jgi:hypothetical protein
MAASKYPLLDLRVIARVGLNHPDALESVVDRRAKPFRYLTLMRTYIDKRFLLSQSSQNLWNEVTVLDVHGGI